MRYTVRISIFALCVLVLPTGVIGAADSTVASEERAAAARLALEGFDELANRAVEGFNVPGLAMAVVAGGEVVYAEGFGHRDIESDLPMTPDTLFAIGSTTKAMTATLLGMLADEGKLAWDEPLRTYLPAFRLSDSSISQRITPRDLVTHRSGLPRHDLLWYNNNTSTREELVERLAHLELSADLREKFQYNNLMFMTAGYLAGRLSGTTWEEAMRARLFDSLGMQRSTFAVSTSQRDPDHALPYRENDDDELERIPFREIDLVGPAGSVNSSVNEMSRWLLFNLRGGTVGDRRLIGEATLADIHSPHMTTGASPQRPDISVSTYGMGWSIDTYRGHRRITHGGGIDGFITSVMFFPDDDLGLVAFNNRGAGLPELLCRHAADRILGLEDVDWVGEALERRQKGKEEQKQAEERKDSTRVAGTSFSHRLADYAGEYVHPGYGTLVIALSGETLEVRFNDIVGPLEHWHYDVWSGADTDGDTTFENEKLLFHSNMDGMISAVEGLFEPRVAPVVFRKRPDSRLSDPAFLQGLVGLYETATGMKIRIELSGDLLTANIPGQQQLTLEPDLTGRFVIREMRVMSLAFELDQKGRAVKALLHRPGGVFEAPRVEE